ncbi:MAG: adenylate/guanylate cyclase domain-containing protein [Candidatus Limnocylindria bacterium]
MGTDAAVGVERRIVTVLFADLVGFTTLSERLDAEDVASVQDAYFGAVRETIGRYGGRLEKFIGDAAMAVFGIPRTRDDDAERAVRAGLALVGAVDRLGGRLGLDEGDLRVRVGVNSGEVVHAESGPDEGRVTGDTINVAARLQTAADPGTVLVGETTALATAGGIELEQREPLELKGKTEPVRASVAIGVHATDARENAMGRLRAPTIGRTAEVERLASWLHSALSARAGRAVIVAPPGVGKTRLVGELAGRAAEVTAPREVAVWRARLRAEVVAPYDTVAQLFRAALASSVSDADATPISAADARAAAARVVRGRLGDAGAAAVRADVVTERALDVAWPTGDVDGQAGEDAAQLFEAWIEALDALAAAPGALWIVEDAHWAGPDLLAFLELAGRQPGSAPRAVVATTRPSLLEVAGDWCAVEPPTGLMLELGPLPVDDASELVRALIGDALPDDLVRTIAERSDGNPLFVEELLRTWVSVGTLVPDGDRWRLDAAVDDVMLPRTVQAIYAGQLDDLPGAARAVARRGSVAGRRFPSAALASLEVSAAEDGVQTLRRRALVSGPHDDALVGDTFAYRHALLRDAAYASLARAERARLHVAMARWLEEVAGDRPAEVAELIAGHYVTALQAAPPLAREVAAGTDRDAVRELAAAWSERGAEAAVAVSAHAAARSLYRLSLDNTSDEAMLDLARRWLRLGEITATSGDMDEAARAIDRSIELYRGALAGPRESAEAARDGFSRSVSALASVWGEQIRFGQAEDLARAALAEIGERDDVATARLLVARGQNTWNGRESFDEAYPDLERALELARAGGDKRIELAAMDWLTLVRSERGTGRPEEWLVVERLAREVGDWAAVASAIRVLAMHDLDDRTADALRELDRMEEVTVAHGLTELGGWADYARTEAGFLIGDWDRARAAGLRAIALAEEYAYVRVAVRTWHLLIPLAAAREDRPVLERAARWYAEVVDRPVATGGSGQPDSPYARVIRPGGVDLPLARFGLMPFRVPGPERTIPSFRGPHGSPSWLEAIETVIDCWLEADLLDAVASALERYADPDGPENSAVAKAVGSFLVAKLERARHAAPATIAAAARSALERFRAAGAAWWTAKAVWFLESVGEATPAEEAEAAQIARRLQVANATIVRRRAPVTRA